MPEVFPPVPSQNPTRFFTGGAHFYLSLLCRKLRRILLQPLMPALRYQTTPAQASVSQNHLSRPYKGLVPASAPRALKTWQSRLCYRHAALIGGSECQKSGGAEVSASCRGYRGEAPNPCAAAHFPQTSEALFAGNDGQLGIFQQTVPPSSGGFYMLPFSVGSPVNGSMTSFMLIWSAISSSLDWFWMYF